MLLIINKFDLPVEILKLFLSSGFSGSSCFEHIVGLSDFSVVDLVSLIVVGGLGVLEVVGVVVVRRHD